MSKGGDQEESQHGGEREEEHGQREGDNQSGVRTKKKKTRAIGGGINKDNGREERQQKVWREGGRKKVNTNGRGVGT